MTGSWHRVCICHWSWKQRHDTATFAHWAKTGVMQGYDDLRLSRLCAYLRKREPDERITYGVFVYELNGPPGRGAIQLYELNGMGPAGRFLQAGGGGPSG